MIFRSVKWDLSIKLVRVQLFMAVNSPEPRVRIFHGWRREEVTNGTTA